MHLDLRSALSATRAEAADRNDPVAKVSDLRVLGVDLGEGLEHVSQHLADALVSPRHPRLTLEAHLHRRVPFHLGVEFCQHSFEVSTVVRINSALDRLDVLLRHRPRSIAPCRRQQRHGFHPSPDNREGLALPPIRVPVAG